MLGKKETAGFSFLPKPGWIEKHVLTAAELFMYLDQWFRTTLGVAKPV